MKKIILVTAILASSGVFAHGHEPVNFEGNYACKGTEVDSDVRFTCDETIKKTGSTYAFTATCSDGSAYNGTGIYDSKNHCLSVVFRNTKKLDEVGLSVKKINKNGVMIGQWTNLDKTAIGHTNCSKTS